MSALPTPAVGPDSCAQAAPAKAPADPHPALELLRLAGPANASRPITLSDELGPAAGAVAMVALEAGIAQAPKELVDLLYDWAGVNDFRTTAAARILNCYKTRQCELNLADIGLCNLPEGALQYLPWLKVIDLSNNNLVSLPPQVFANLTQLETVYLEKNGIKTFADDLFAECPNIDTVLLSENNIANQFREKGKPPQWPEISRLEFFAKSNRTSPKPTSSPDEMREVARRTIEVASPLFQAGKSVIDSIRSTPRPALWHDGRVIAVLTKEGALSSGAMKAVYKALDSAGRMWAVAIISKREIQGNDFPLRQEIDLHRMLRDAPQISRLEHSVETDRSFYLIYDLYEGGDLTRFLSRAEQDKSLPELLHLAEDLCIGVAEIHRMGIIHHDIKPENVLLHPDQADGKLRAYISDFGAAIRPDLQDKRRIGGGTVSFYSPELFWALARPNPEERITAMIPKITPQSDLWALGVTLFEMFLGNTKFQNLFNIPQLARPDRRRTMAERDQQEPIARQTFEEFLKRPNEDDSLRPAAFAQSIKEECNLQYPQHPALGDLLSRLLSIDPALRPSAQDALDIIRQI